MLQLFCSQGLRHLGANHAHIFHIAHLRSQHGLRELELTDCCNIARIQVLCENIADVVRLLFNDTLQALLEK